MKMIIKNSNCLYGRPNWQSCFTIALMFTCTMVTELASGLSLVPLRGQITDDDKAITASRRPLGLQSSKVTPTLNKEPVAEHTQKDVCISAACVHASSAVFNKMNNEIEPCDDFYQFACGKYIAETKIPDDKVSMNIFWPILDNLLLQLRTILTEELHQTAPKHRRLPNMLYTACMDTTSIERLGTKYIHQISEALCGWPVLFGNCWDSDNSWNWQDLVKKLRLIGFSTNSILTFTIKVDWKNNTKRIIELDQSSTALKRDYLIKGLSETSVSAYYEYMVDIAVLFGAEKTAAQKELRESLQFEMDLANISWSDEKRLNANDLYNLRSIKQLQESYPYVQWLDYINAHLTERHQVDENEIIKLSVPSFFDELGKLLERTDKRVLANYMMWHFYGFSVNFMPKDFRTRLFEYDTALSGRRVEQPRWKECVDMTLDSLPIAVGSLYVRKYFKQNSKAATYDMFTNIREAFSHMLDDVAWMDDTTKQDAKRKLLSMEAQIGYPDEILNDHKLEKYYSALEIDTDKYFEAILSITAFDTDNSFSKLRLPVVKSDWEGFFNPAVMNAFYSLTENVLKFPAAILQGHLFNEQRPKYMNYGAVGSIIGHEITHGFDDIGSQFDFRGTLFNWWQPVTENVYWEKATCVIEQYGNYTEKQTGLSLDGFNTRNENIADIGGIKASYLAYNKWLAKNGAEPQLPGLNYTARQMFWISAAQSWCAKYTKENLAMSITADIHAPYEFRALGPLRNLPDFSRDFQCPANTAMNPAKKCEVW